VEDDGVGISGSEGNGIHGMRERAAAAGAGFVIGPAGASGGSGTRVEVTW
jgi:two-component system sensor histidine kinase DesK